MTEGQLAPVRLFGVSLLSTLSQQLFTLAESVWTRCETRRSGPSVCMPLCTRGLAIFRQTYTPDLSTVMASLPMLMTVKAHLNSGFVVLLRSGKVPSFANAVSSSVTLCIHRVASPPSSTSGSHPSICSVHH